MPSRAVIHHGAACHSIFVLPISTGSLCLGASPVLLSWCWASSHAVLIYFLLKTFCFLEISGERVRLHYRLANNSLPEDLVGSYSSDFACALCSLVQATQAEAAPLNMLFHQPDSLEPKLPGSPPPQGNRDTVHWENSSVSKTNSVLRC